MLHLKTFEVHMNFIKVAKLLGLITLFGTQFTTKSLASPICNDVYVNQVIQQLENLEDSELISLSDCGLKIVPQLSKVLEQEKSSAAMSKAAIILRMIGPGAKASTPLLRKILSDQSQEIFLRADAADTLAAIKPEDSQTISDLLEILENEKNTDLLSSSAFALAANAKNNNEAFNVLLNIIDDSISNDIVKANVLFAITQNPDFSTAEERLQMNQICLSIIEDANQGNRVIAACVFSLGKLNGIRVNNVDNILQLTNRNHSGINQQVAEALAEFSRNLYQDSVTLQQVSRNRKLVEKIQSKIIQIDPENNTIISDSQSNISEVVNTFDVKKRALWGEIARQWLFGSRAFWILHPLIWIGLIFAYPKSRRIQAFFFWNKHVRSVLGCGYVGPLISSVAPLRQRLFAPFKDSLLADAKLNFFEPQSYFADSRVQLKGGKTVQLLAEVLPVIKGQVILEGESGLGKTMLLRHLVSQTKRVTVFLPAHKCENGVIEAIQAKLHGQAQDADFLRHLIYSGALDICIDGLNEVRAEVRANITAFVESYFKGNIVMTTQPLLWEPPATAKTYVLQPLQRQQIQQFLMVSQGYQPDHNSPETEAYAKNCNAFLERALDEDQPPEELAAARRILSNPMDLSVVAQLIRNSLVPDLFQLRQQQYTLMAQDYEQSWNQQFPLKQFSEFVYQMRLNDISGMTGGDFYQALSIMEKEQHRMVLSRQWKDANGEPQKEWSFRHDKIMEFFLVQTFLGTSQETQEKRHQHLGDPRFRGIYLLLARLLPMEAALALREDLIHYAADTKDHTVSDNYVQILRSRTTETSSLDLA